MLAGDRQERKLRVGTWNFSGLCSEHKQKEVGELLKVKLIILTLWLVRSHGRKRIAG